MIITSTHFSGMDNDGHMFWLPIELKEEFQLLLEKYSNAKRFTEEYYTLEAEFENKFSKYMVG